MRHLHLWGQILLSHRAHLGPEDDPTALTLPLKLKFKTGELSAIFHTSKQNRATTRSFPLQTKACSVNFLSTEGTYLSMICHQPMKRGQVCSQATAVTIVVYPLMTKCCITFMLAVTATQILLFVMCVANSVATNMDSIPTSWEAINAKPALSFLSPPANVQILESLYCI